MMKYVAGASNEVLDLRVVESLMSFSGGIDGHSYSYTLGADDMKEARLNPQTVTVPYAGTWAAFDRLLRHSEADIAAGKPGRIVKDTWTKRAFITGATHKKSAKGRIKTKLRIALLDGAWWRTNGVSLIPSENPQASGLDYPYDYDYDYSQSMTGGYVTTGVLTPSKPRLVFYGPATDPEITIAGNRYMVSGSVAAGARIEVDGRYKTVKLITVSGETTDKFADALRGSGEGGGEYIFQPIPPGTQDVIWDGSFGVDVGWYEEASEPTWNQS